MHPAPSVIIFTTLSGLGFGLFMWMGLGIPDVTGWTAFWMFFIAYALAVGGLLSSTFHLANPKNAIHSFSQWRTSWLSREGVFSLAALAALAIYAIGRIFFDTALPFWGYLGATLSFVTVFSTSMIYGQLKTIPRWNMPLTPALFIMYSLAGGALLAGKIQIAGFLLLLLGFLQILGWVVGDRRLADTGSNKGTASGLGDLGKVRMLETAHTARNYVLDEMVHLVGRKHAQKLRVIAIIFGMAIPAALLLLTPPGHALAFVAFAAHLAGVFTARWLFFAEAEHVVGFYYSRG